MSDPTLSPLSRELSRLVALCQQGALDVIDWHFARAVGAWGVEGQGGAGPGAAEVVLAAALVCHLAGSGHACVDLAAQAGRPLPFDPARLAPPLARWQQALADHPACGLPLFDQGSLATRPLVLDGQRLYLARHWSHEVRVAADLTARMQHLPPVHEARLEAGLERIFGREDATRGQREAAALASRSPVAVISGGPGTGKTTTLAALLALIIEQQENPASGPVASPLRILLAAPTGKAAARMQEAVRQARGRLPLAVEVAAGIPDQARTLHRLLGLRPDGNSRYHGGHHLPVDLLVVDEASMVDLTLMARLLAALPPRARLVLLGDRDQLASVEAGAVFADLCQSATEQGILAAGFGQLNHSFRFGDQAGIGRLARCLREGNSAAALALLQKASQSGDAVGELVWQPTPDPDGAVQAALAGYGAYLEAVRAGRPVQELQHGFGKFRLLTAHRQGPWGVARFNSAIERALAGTLGHDPRQPWYPGRPVMVAANDYALGLFNGDIGIAAPDPECGELMVWFEGEGGALRPVAPQRLPAFDPAWALTVHKSQGSEFDRVLLVLPDQPSPLVSRELVYTAVTRARQSVQLWATASALREACQRRIERYSGLAQRLGTGPRPSPG